MKRHAMLVQVLVSTALAAGCAQPAHDAGPVKPAGPEKAKGMLPAWRLPWEKKIPGQVDQYDDYRAANPQWYAVTAPPDKAGFRSLQEYEQVQALILAYTGGLPSNVDGSIVGMVKASIDVVDSYVLVDSSQLQSEFVGMLKAAGISQAKIDAKVHFVVLDLDSIWTVDFGPFPLVAPDGTLAFSDFRYYQNRVYDDAVPTRLGKLWGTTTYRAPMDYEGGNFYADEAGTCYFTQGAYWENADKTETDVQGIMTSYLGCKKFIVLQPLPGEGTTHIDMFFKPASKNVVVLGKATSADSSTNVINTLEADNSILTGATLADGSKLTVIRIPMPYQKDGVWRTYTNSTYTNPINLVPVYPSSKTHEAEAMDVWKTAMPAWTHVGIDSTEIITWGGAMHCISRTIPKTKTGKWIENGTCSGGKCQAPAGGYDGSCGTSSDCFGPKWLCNYNECGTSAGCGGVTYEGCCDGKTLKYCDNNKLTVQQCPNSCGWDNSKKFYDCGFTGADPSGQNPIQCPGVCTPNCTGKACGPDGCGGSCGTCPAGQTCDATGKCAGCTPNCANKFCGDDGCGGSCGTCPAGQTCQAGQCVGCTPNCTGKECGGDGCNGSCGTCPAGKTCDAAGKCVTQTDPCQGITIQGCCDGKVNKWCENNQLQSEDCGNQACGWATPQGYVAGYYCGGSGSDPSGKYPKACPGTCTANCNGKVCGDDGCGGSCGTCGAGKTCNASGQCVGCTANCTGKECGDDGCGGTCGICAAGKTCTAGKCVAAGACGANPALSCKGACDNQGAGGCWCDAACKQYSDCCPDVDACCGACTPDCTGKVCGSDGCAGTCGSCPAGQACNSVGQCIACTPSCTGKQCGDDGCGGSCGQCAPGKSCEAGKCVDAQAYPNICLGTDQPSASTCIPGLTYEGCCDDKSRVVYCENGQLFCIDCSQNQDAADKVCGWKTIQGGAYYDCGGSGPDPGGKFPIECQGGCVPACAGKECGNDGCGGSCGTCTGGKSCNAAGLCVACTPNCTGKECGGDGCGGSCGICKAGCTCSSSGQCMGSCGTPDCTGKECGSDGAGGSCGTCPTGKTCDATGHCVTCTQSCTGKECGDDGCGGTCGTCPAGTSCNAAGKCDTTCKPDCTDKVCGPDGCNGSCGSCAPGFECDTAGKCQPIKPEPQPEEVPDTACTPDCTGKSCGDNGCGGTCGTCPGGYTCNAAFNCVVVSNPEPAVEPSPEPAGDVPVAGDPGPTPDMGGETGGKSGGGCSAAGTGGQAAPCLLFAMLPFVGFLRSGRKHR